MQILQRLQESGQVPNALTCIRIGLSWLPGALIVMNPDSTTYRWWSVLAFMAIVITDKLDGMLARRWQQITQLGKILDPLADKLLVVALVVALCMTDILAAPWGWLFLGFNLVRELGVTLARYRQKRGRASLVIAATDNGKRKMFLQSAGIGLALMPIAASWWPAVVWAPLAASLFYSLRSGVEYLRAK